MDDYTIRALNRIAAALEEQNKISKITQKSLIKQQQIVEDAIKKQEFDNPPHRLRH